MPEAVFDFAAINKIANLKALEGRPQNVEVELKPVGIEQDDFYSHMGFEFPTAGDWTVSSNAVWSIAENCMVPVDG